MDESLNLSLEDAIHLLDRARRDRLESECFFYRLSVEDFSKLIARDGLDLYKPSSEECWWINQGSIISDMVVAEIEGGVLVGPAGVVRPISQKVFSYRREGETIVVVLNRDYRFKRSSFVLVDQKDDNP